MGAISQATQFIGNAGERRKPDALKVPVEPVLDQPADALSSTRPHWANLFPVSKVPIVNTSGEKYPFESNILKIASESGWGRFVGTVSRSLSNPAGPALLRTRNHCAARRLYPRLGCWPSGVARIAPAVAPAG